MGILSIKARVQRLEKARVSGAVHFLIDRKIELRIVERAVESAVLSFNPALPSIRLVAETGALYNK